MGAGGIPGGLLRTEVIDGIGYFLIANFYLAFP